MSVTIAESRALLNKAAGYFLECNRLYNEAVAAGASAENIKLMRSNRVQAWEAFAVAHAWHVVKVYTEEGG